MHSKFIVIKLQELIRTGIFALIGLGVVLALIFIFASPFGERTALYVPGTYAAEIHTEDAPLTVYITVDEFSIRSVSLGEADESAPLFYPLFAGAAEELSKAVVKAQSTDVALPDGAEVTGGLILAAIDEGLGYARITP